MLLRLKSFLDFGLTISVNAISETMLSSSSGINGGIVKTAGISLA